MQPFNHLILSIDTSCDETSVAVTKGVTVLSNVIASQVELHKQYGGVFPTVAKQAHKENIDNAIKLALKKANLTIEQLQAIAVTQGPGLAPALEVGISKALELAQKFDKPLIGVNHVEGHLLSVLAKRKSKIICHSGTKMTKSTEVIKFHRKTNKILSPRHSPGLQDDSPAINHQSLSIIVSGGHTQFVLVNSIGDYQILGHTIDDAAGEALDKVGRILELGYPAGPVMEEFAKKGDPKRFKFALPMTTSHDYNLSYSGLKTQARNLIEGIAAKSPLSKQDIYDLSASFQYAVFHHICHKLSKILQEHNFDEVWLGGGVAANMTLRRMIRETLNDRYKNQTRKDLKVKKLSLKTPFEKRLCGDNAVMIGIVANFKLDKNEVVKNVAELDRKPRWEIEDTNII